MSDCPICPICQGNVGFPVQLVPDILPDNCKCKQPSMCLTCVRDMLQLNSRDSTTNSTPIYNKCIYCRKPLLITHELLTKYKIFADLIYVKDFTLAKKLDLMCPTYQCPRCYSWNGTRIEWEAHHIKECPNAINRCSNKGCNYVGKCIVKHRETCKFMKVKCEFCGISHWGSDTITHQRGCKMYKIDFYRRNLRSFMCVREKLLKAKEQLCNLSTAMCTTETPLTRLLDKLDKFDTTERDLSQLSVDQLDYMMTEVLQLEYETELALSNISSLLSLITHSD